MSLRVFTISILLLVTTFTINESSAQEAIGTLNGDTIVQITLMYISTKEVTISPKWPLLFSKESLTG